MIVWHTRTVTIVPSLTSPNATTLNATGSVLFDRQWLGRTVQTKSGEPVRINSPGCSDRKSPSVRSARISDVIFVYVSCKICSGVSGWLFVVDELLLLLVELLLLLLVLLVVVFAFDDDPVVLLLFPEVLLLLFVVVPLLFVALPPPPLTPVVLFPVTCIFKQSLLKN